MALVSLFVTTSTTIERYSQRNASIITSDINVLDALSASIRYLPPLSANLPLPVDRMQGNVRTSMLYPGEGRR